MATILHISDIHRTPNAEVSNVVLLDGLLRDLDRQGIRRGTGVDLIIVSGDVIQGVGPDDPDADTKLTAQYAEASTFLGALANELLGGYRNRIIIVPGNHDINWRASTQSMTKLPGITGDALKNQLAQVLTGRSKIRWSWDSLGFFHISDSDLYARRMEHYATFIAQFHEDARRFPEDDQAQYGVHVFPDHRLVVLALNSCWNNDHLQYVGQIRNECIALAATELRERGLGDHLVMAVWHHNTRGLPLETGYLDYRCLEYLLDAGVTLGLHGHQHLTEVVTEQARLMRGRRMLVVSAGSLCAGPRELPAGERRSYNVIRISADNKRLSVTTRVSVSSDPFALIWTADSPGVVEADLPPVDTTPPRPPARDLDDAADLIRARRPADALAILGKIPETSSSRRLRLECYLATFDSSAIVRDFNPPTSNGEVIAVLDAAWELHRRDIIGEVLSTSIVRDSEDPAVRGVREKFRRLVGRTS